MFTPSAIKVLEKRYLLKDDTGAVSETPEQLFRRVAGGVAQAEKVFSGGEEACQQWSEKFFQSMYKGEFLPNSPTLFNAGKPKGQLSACFVLPVPDTLEGIFETCKNAALIHKTGGGTGFSFSRLRPANDRVATTSGVASGPVSFMTVYDAATEAIRQGGTRRGANMGILRVDHPDIEDFITCKKDTSKLHNFNISVAATNAFMKAVEEDSTYSLIHPRTGEAVQELRAQDIFEKMVTNAHATGEPGLVFLDRINENDPLRTAFDENGEVIPGTEEIEATNPCGEQPLGPGDACNLGSINLTRFVDTQKNDFDWEHLRESVNLSVRFLDDVVEANHYPLPFINAATRNNRRIGLGIMGWAESLILLGIVYDSEDAVRKAEELMSFIQEVSHEASRNLAEERGCFPNWKHSTWSDRGIKMRNVTVTTIAPTGTISIIAGTSSGIEPLFAISFVRRVMGGTELIEVNPLFEKVAKERGFYSLDLMEKIAREGTIKHIDEIPEDVRKIWVCSHDISYEWHVRMQVAFQQFTDNAVSKTINLPHTAPVEDVRQAYLAAWRMGLKGITVYRDASRALQVLNIRKTDPTKQSQPKSDTEYGEPQQPVEQSTPLNTDDSNGINGTNGTNGTNGSNGVSGTNGKNGVIAFPAATAATRPGSSKTKVITAGDQSSNGISTLNSATKISTQTAEQSNVHQISERRCTECGSASAFEARYEACVMCRVCGYTKC
jgi:ribonucleoside-diphosphate reductase alpha chain